MATFTDITGKIEDAPECPEHEGVALILEVRPITKGKNALWRCPVSNKLYQEDAMSFAIEDIPPPLDDTTI